MFKKFRTVLSKSSFSGLCLSLASQLRLKLSKQNFYSQSQEDFFIAKYCPEKIGNYIDVGSGRPISGSNSYFFYKQGWSGLLIDPIRRNKLLTNLLRPRDNFSNSLAGEAGRLNFYEMYPYEYSTTSHEISENLQSRGLATLIKVREIKVLPLSDFKIEMQELRPTFISIDAEGADFQILQSIDWLRCKPRVICIESPHKLDLNEKKVVKYLKNLGYLMAEQTALSKIFVSKKYLNILN